MVKDHGILILLIIIISYITTSCHSWLIMGNTDDKGYMIMVNSREYDYIMVSGQWFMVRC